MKRNYYEVLGIDKEADPEAIKRAYRKLAMEHHPDRNQGDASAEEKFKEAAEAHEVLSDPEKRAQYDHASKPHPFSFHMSDIFGGGMSWQNGEIPTKGQDIVLTYNVTFATLFADSRHSMEYKRQEYCGKCAGKCVKAGRSKKTCNHCNGNGRISHQTIQGNNRQVQITPCGRCNGKGKIVEPADRCEECQGIGSKITNQTLNFQIPRGMPLDRKLVHANEGNVGYHGGPRGDVYVGIGIKDHPNLKFNPQRTYELICELKMPFWKAVQGGEEIIEGADGKPITIDVPIGCQGGTIKRVTGEGLPIFGRQERGDLVVIYQVAVPNNLSDEMKSLVENMRILEQSNDGKEDHIQVESQGSKS